MRPNSIGIRTVSRITICVQWGNWADRQPALVATTRNGDNVWGGTMALKDTLPLRGSKDPRLLPAYPVAEAAHYLRMPEGTLRSWVVGRLYPAAGQSRRSRLLIHLDDPGRRYLSFINLVEAHV